MNKLVLGGEVPCVLPQNLYEFWVVCTRPTSQNGLGMTPSEARSELSRLRRQFDVLEEAPTILPGWELLVMQYQVSGKNAHDAHLVAAMIVHGISRILTFNVGDFRRYSNISVLDPLQVLASDTSTP